MFDIIMPSRKRRVINVKTIHRGKNQLVFFQALVLPSFNIDKIMIIYNKLPFLAYKNIIIISL
jgi:hypothetical protein